jgi:hypothetical protein
MNRKRETTTSRSPATVLDLESFRMAINDSPALAPDVDFFVDPLPEEDFFAMEVCGRMYKPIFAAKPQDDIKR